MKNIFGPKFKEVLQPFILGLLLYWTVLSLKPPDVLTRIFQGYSLGLFVFVLAVYYFTYRLPGKLSVITGLGYTLLLLAFALLYRWTSGYSDNFLIGGLLPYKDAKNFFVGSNLILNGMPLVNAGQATERPLFPSFFSSVLLLSGGNLKISIAILVNFVGLGLYASSRRVFHSFGALAASLYSTLLFFYIQPWAGYTMSEPFGFLMGCVALYILWPAARQLKRLDLIIGLLVLLIAVSARAGTFLIFPILAIWVGWAFRNDKRFSVKAGVITLLVIVIGYFTVNTLYARIMGVPEGSSFGNFAYALYGQVRGGTGWHTAIEELGTRNPAVVYKAAFDFFTRHPLSLLIGVAKSYRDFSLPGYSNIFSFDVAGQPVWITYIMWFVFIALLFLGLFRLIRNTRNNAASFLLAGFLGVVLSIPFLPPIDGGSRFYASTVPFFFVIPVIGLSKSPDWEQADSERPSSQMGRYGSLALILLTLILPILTSTFSKKIVPGAVACQPAQEAFVIRANPGSYIDLVQEENTSCGLAPKICFDDFLENNTELHIDDFYQQLYSLASTSQNNMRILPTLNLLDGNFHYFVITDRQELEISSQKLLSGCATRILTENQRIFLIESISTTDNYRSYAVELGRPKIGGTSGARTPYFRHLFANCVSPKLIK